MQEISIEEMLDAGAHFGHQTRRWNPKMRPYIYGARSGVHIIDLQQTQSLVTKALSVAEEIVAKGQSILFVGTKNQAQNVIEEEAKRCSMPYISRRWLGGMLTNFGTISRSIERYLELETRREKNDFEGFTKKERLGIDREIGKYDIVLGGIKNMKKLPGGVFVVDPQVEKIAVHEANLLGLPVIAILDSNCNPDPIDYLIPANDDAVRSIKVFTEKIADACLRGLEKRELLARQSDEKPAKKTSRMAKTVKGVEGAGKAYVSKADSFEATEKVETFSASVDKEESSEKKEVQPQAEEPAPVSEG